MIISSPYVFMTILMDSFRTFYLINQLDLKLTMFLNDDEYLTNIFTLNLLNWSQRFFRSFAIYSIFLWN